MSMAVRRTVGALAAATVMLWSLSACDSTEEPGDASTRAEASVPVEGGSPSSSPVIKKGPPPPAMRLELVSIDTGVVGAGRANEVLVLTTFGEAMCPLGIGDVEEVANGAIRIALSDREPVQRSCKSRRQVTRQQVDLPGGLAAATVSGAVVVFGDGPTYGLSVVDKTGEESSRGQNVQDGHYCCYDPSGRVLVSEHVTFAMKALGGGRLQLVGGCLGASGNVIVWPQGTEVVKNEPLTIRIPASGTFAIGDTVRVGGGFVLEHTSDDVEPGDYEVAGVTVPAECAEHDIFVAHR